MPEKTSRPWHEIAPLSDAERAVTPRPDDDDNCALCDGCGELRATTKRAEQDTVGCPLCIQRDKDEVIARL